MLLSLGFQSPMSILGNSRCVCMRRPSNPLLDLNRDLNGNFTKKLQDAEMGSRATRYEVGSNGSAGAHVDEARIQEVADRLRFIGDELDDEIRERRLQMPSHFTRELLAIWGSLMAFRDRCFVLLHIFTSLLWGHPPSRRSTDRTGSH